jgi:flagellar hook-length control protein FliK
VESLHADEPAASEPPPATAPATPHAQAASNATALIDAATPRTAPPGPASVAASAPEQTPVAPEVQFAEDNHPGIVAGIRGQLLPSGGTMQIRLDPPELGPLAVTINIRNGAVEASFEASSDQAAKLLSHSLSALKTSLESQGVSVERLNVQHAPKGESGGNNGNNSDPQQNQPRDPQQEQAAQREQQRREMLRRMWRKLSGTEDPLDMVA